jgi:ectoine hydroxylase-related dioxygenase (phytanoyl-CoA dioxygenase family)
MVKPGPEIARLITYKITEHAQALAGSPLKATGHPQLLLSLPHKKPWSLDELNWHTDVTIPEEDRCPGVQAFVLLADLAPKGGATLALRGSHLLKYGRPRVSADEFMRADPSRVVEMSGSAGDVYFMDLRVLHSPSVNAGRGVRMMVTERFLVPG